MRITNIGIIGLFTFIISLPVLADKWGISHSCTKPYKPYEFSNQWEIDSFNDEVEEYKSCIAEFVEEQNEEAKEHKKAAEDAVDEWNDFVNYELN